MDATLRFLELVRRELGSTDARLELSLARAASDRHEIHATVAGGPWRIVATFDEAPADLAAKHDRLRELVATFEQLEETATAGAPSPAREAAVHSLTAQLEELAGVTEALCALVIDDSSPVVWGSSGVPGGDTTVEEALRVVLAADRCEAAGLDLAELLAHPDRAFERLRAAELDASLAHELASEVAGERARARRRADAMDRAAWQRRLTVLRAVARVRNGEDPQRHRVAIQDDHLGLLMRSFASIYRLLLVFEGRFSELKAEGETVHVLPIIENLVLALPPVDPGPKGGRLYKLRP